MVPAAAAMGAAGSCMRPGREQWADVRFVGKRSSHTCAPERQSRLHGRGYMIATMVQRVLGAC
jgi:hypothetical protein